MTPGGASSGSCWWRPCSRAHPSSQSDGAAVARAAGATPPRTTPSDDIYYFPWAISALLKWSAFCAVTARRPRLDTNTRDYFDVADSDLSYGDKLAAYARLADEHFETDRYAEFCATSLASLDEIVRDWVAGPEFDALLVDTVRRTYPVAEQDRFVAHFRGLLGLWVTDNAAA